MSDDEIRWYKGKYKVRIIKKSNVGVKGKHLIRNILVEALENIRGKRGFVLPKGFTFTTVPRLLWRHQRGKPMVVKSYKRKPKGGKRKSRVVKAHFRGVKKQK